MDCLKKMSRKLTGWIPCTWIDGNLRCRYGISWGIEEIISNLQDDICNLQTHMREKCLLGKRSMSILQQRRVPLSSVRLCIPSFKSFFAYYQKCPPPPLPYCLSISNSDKTFSNFLDGENGVDLISFVWGMIEKWFANDLLILIPINSVWPWRSHLTKYSAQWVTIFGENNAFLYLTASLHLQIVRCKKNEKLSSLNVLKAYSNASTMQNVLQSSTTVLPWWSLVPAVWPQHGP